MGMQSFRYQRGAATVLMSILVGFSITAMGLALMFNVQSAQDKQITAQAQVNAQSIAWAGSEAFRQVLAAMPAEELNKLAVGSEFKNAEGANNKLRPRVVEIQDVAAAGAVKAHKQITVDLVANDPVAQVGTRLQVVYSVFEAIGRPKRPPLDGSMFYDNTKSEGDVEFKNPDGKGEAITVKGNLEIMAKVSGIASIKATGNVVLRDNLVKEIKANGKVTLGGSAQVTDLLIGRAEVDINDGFAGTVKSNGYIYFKPSKPANLAANTRPVVKEVIGGSIKIDNQNNTDFESVRSGTTAVLGGSCDTAARCFSAVEAAGNISVDLGQAGSVASATQISCSNASNLPSGLAVAPQLLNCPTNASIKKEIPSLKPIVPIEEFDLDPLPIDVWEHEVDANYVISMEAARTLVKVQNVVSGTTPLNGNFELVFDGVNGAQKGYLCLLNDKLVQEPACTKEYVFCSDGCWTTANEADWKTTGAAPKTFYLSGHLAPGVILFDGNLNMKNTKLSPAALLSSGYIVTEDNNTKTLALNFAGPSGGSFASVTLPGVCSELAGDSINLIPSNFCVGSEYDSTAANNLGNVSLMAGGAGNLDKTIATTTAALKETDKAETTSQMKRGADGKVVKTVTKIIPDPVSALTTTEITTSSYSGGNIRIAAKNVIFGSILAGNLLRTEGESVVYGYVVSSGLAKAPTAANGTIAFNLGGIKGLEKNELSAKTVVDHSVAPNQYYKGNILPGTVSDGESGEGEGSNGDKAKVMRARYL